MTTLNITDLPGSEILDRKARAEVKGRGEWHLLSSFVNTGSWGNYTRMYANYVGTTFHDGYLSRHYSEGWQRQRTQTEYSYWDHFVRV